MANSAFFVILLLLISSGCAWGQETSGLMLSLRDLPRTGMPAPWELKVKTGLPDFRVEEEHGVLAACLTSHSASFSIQRKARIDPGRLPILTWQWLVSELPLQGDLRRSDYDDQAAQLFLLFQGGKAISYIWDSNAPVGTVEKSSIPFLLTIKVIVIESGSAKLNKWQSYTRDVQQDYEQLFGGAPPAIEAMRFQINSQRTDSKARSCLAGLMLSARKPRER